MNAPTLPTTPAPAGQQRRPVILVDGQPRYRCTKCDAVKQADEFPRLSNPLSRCRVGSWCYECVRVYDRTRAPAKWAKTLKQRERIRLAHQSRMAAGRAGGAA